MDGKENLLDYEGMLGLARSCNIKVIEAEGIEEWGALRFQQQGKEYIALDAGLPDKEKSRALGFFLNSYSGGHGAQTAQQSGASPSDGDMQLLSLRCPQG